MRLIADIGAYNMLLTAAIPTLTMLMANGTYAIPAIRTTLTEVFTNKTPTDAYRGAGRPEATYFVERAMDMLARELKMDPAELRRRNFIPPDQFPYATQMGAVYDSGDYGKALDLALKASNWKALVAERDAARKEGRLVGLGLAMYVEVCGLGPSSSLPTGGWEHSQVTIERDGRISATTGASPHGQGNETTFAQMLADQFSVPIEHITIHHGDTGVVKQGIGTFGSRSQAVGGTALHLAGGKVKAKMAKFAAALLEAHEDDIVFENGRIGVKGSPASAKSFAEVAGYAYVPVPLPPGLEPGLSEEAFFEPANNTYPFGCVITMLEIDRETGEPTLLKLVAVDDAGNLINPLIVEGQIHGGLAQGIGQAMVEEAVYNDDGQLLTGSFMDYALPRATDFPRFELHATVTPTPVNPLGAKGVGEAGTLGSTPSIVNAAVDALVGVRRDAHRHDAAAREAVAHHPRRPGVIPTTFEYARATSLDDALAKLKAGRRGRQVHRRRPQPRAADEAAPERAAGADRHQPHSGPQRHSRARRQDHHRRRHRAPRRRDVCPPPGQVPGRRRGGRQHRRPAGAQPGHDRRQRRARRSVGRHAGRAAGARRGDPPQGTQGLARGEGARTSSRTSSRWTCAPTRSSRACSSCRCGPRRTPSCISARRTTPSSASRRRSR